MKKIKFLSIFLIFFSSVALGDDKYTLIVMLGDKLLDKNITGKIFQRVVCLTSLAGL